MDLDHLEWRTSTFSGGNGGSCVEVAPLPAGGVAVRDTEDRTRPPRRHSAAARQGFLAALRHREFDRS